jgi:hypothetical protein
LLFLVTVREKLLVLFGNVVMLGIFTPSKVKVKVLRGGTGAKFVNVTVVLVKMIERGTAAEIPENIGHSTAGTGLEVFSENSFGNWSKTVLPDGNRVFVLN